MKSNSSLLGQVHGSYLPDTPASSGLVFILKRKRKRTKFKGILRSDYYIAVKQSINVAFHA